MRRHSQIGPWRKVEAHASRTMQTSSFLNEITLPTFQINGNVTGVSVTALLGAEGPPEANAGDLGYAPDMRQEWGSF